MNSELEIGKEESSFVSAIGMISALPVSNSQRYLSFVQIEFMIM